VLLGKLDNFVINLVTIISIGEMVCCVEFDNRKSEVTQLDVIVHFWCHKYGTKGNKPEIQV
jgi:hypothetical protein